MKVVADRRIPGLVEALKGRHEVTALEGADITAADVKDADALIVRTRTRCDELLLGGSSVRLVGTATIGTDHIDTRWCEAHGIRVANAPGCNAPAVMQYVAAGLRLAGFNPGRDTLGVVGKGNIGRLVTELYRRAGTEVLVSDPPRAESGHEDEDYLALEEILERCDAVTFHVPYTGENDSTHPTHHLLTAGLLERHRPPRIIVNASRGLVVHPDVLRRVEKGRRLVTDTWPFEDEPEAWSPEERLRIIANSFISTPHIAGYSAQGKQRATAAMLEALGEENATASPPVPTLPLEEVERSFDPTALSEALKADPASFEALRGAHLRPEAGF